MLLMLRLLANTNMLFLKRAELCKPVLLKPPALGPPSSNRNFAGQHRDPIVARTPSF